jgi:hypothetical protein
MAYLGKAISRIQVVPLAHSLEITLSSEIPITPVSAPSLSGGGTSVKNESPSNQAASSSVKSSGGAAGS